MPMTRCGGFTEFLRGAGVAASGLRHVEYFHDHQRIERMLFDGALDPGGAS